MHLSLRIYTLFTFIAALCIIQCYATTIGHSAAGRLPSYLKPYHYDLLMEPFFANSTFRGRVAIQVHVVESTDVITLHSRGLNITSALVYGHSER